MSSADRLIDARAAITELDPVRYYESAADFILPRLKGRPCFPER